MINWLHKIKWFLINTIIGFFGYAILSVIYGYMLIFVILVPSLKAYIITGVIVSIVIQIIYGFIIGFNKVFSGDFLY